MRPEERKSAVLRPVRFPVGRVVATPGVLDAADCLYLALCLARHQRGDWGQVCDLDRAANERALLTGERLLSAYPLQPEGEESGKLWVITEADRSATTFLLPSEY